MPATSWELHFLWLWTILKMSGILFWMHTTWLWSAHLHGPSCLYHLKAMSQCSGTADGSGYVYLHRTILLMWKHWLTVLHVELWGREGEFLLDNFFFILWKKIFVLNSLISWFTFLPKCCIGVLNVSGCLHTDNCKEIVITGYTQAEARSLT